MIKGRRFKTVYVDDPPTPRQVLLCRFINEIGDVLGLANQGEYGETAHSIFAALGSAAPGYAIAEKGIRYGKRGDVKDLVKAAAYAFLEWERLNA